MFYWYDYLIFVSALSISTGIGIYYGYVTKMPSTVKGYLSGGKKMKILPIALSVCVGHFSAVLLVGVPADIYRYGAFHTLGSISIFFYVSAAIFFFYPILFKTKSKSIFDYLGKRFDYKTKMLGSFLYVFLENIYLPIFVYSPALSLSVVTGVNIHFISFAICGICVFYTAVGGLRTVIWTDLFQLLIVVISLGFLSSAGIYSVGGFKTMWNIASEGQRLDIFDFDLDPTKKDSFWIVVTGSTFHYLYLQCLAHSSVQKYLALNTQKRSTKALIIFGVTFNAIRLSVGLLGLIIYANYAKCDPILNHQITKPDQIVSFFAEQVAQMFPGVLGLFITAVICAGISSLSSALNALAGVIYNDFLIKLIRTERSEAFKVRILKVIVLVEGLICAGLVVLVPYLGDILPMVVGTTGVIEGPIIGMITLGIIPSKIQSNGVFYGVILAVLTMSSIYIPSKYYLYKNKIRYPPKPLSVESCLISNFTANSSNFTTPKKIRATQLPLNSSQPFYLFRISYQYFGLMGFICTIVFALIIDLIEKKIKDKKIFINEKAGQESQTFLK